MLEGNERGERGEKAGREGRGSLLRTYRTLSPSQPHGTATHLTLNPLSGGAACAAKKGGKADDDSDQLVVCSQDDEEPLAYYGRILRFGFSQGEMVRSSRESDGPRGRLQSDRQGGNPGVPAVFQGPYGGGSGVRDWDFNEAFSYFEERRSRRKGHAPSTQERRTRQWELLNRGLRCCQGHIRGG